MNDQQLLSNFELQLLNRKWICEKLNETYIFFQHKYPEFEEFNQGLFLSKNDHETLFGYKIFTKDNTVILQIIDQQYKLKETNFNKEPLSFLLTDENDEEILFESHSMLKELLDPK